VCASSARHALNLAHVELLHAPEEEDEVTRAGSQNGASPAGLHSPADRSLRVEVHHMARSLASSLRAPDFETIRLLPLHQQVCTEAASNQQASWC